MIYRNEDGIILELMDTGECFFNGIPSTIKKINNNIFNICVDNDFSLCIKLFNLTFKIIENYAVEATYGVNDVTHIFNEMIENNKIPISINNTVFNYTGVNEWKKLKVKFYDGLYLTICEGSFFSLNKINDIVKKLRSFKITEHAVYQLLNTYDENTDYFEDNILITIVNHTTKSGFVVSKYNTYAGFYCFVGYYLLKIKDILFFHNYTLTNIFTLDGFSIYKDKYEDDLYKIIFSQKNLIPTEKNLMEKYFSETEIVTKTISNVIQKYKINYYNTLAIYYRGTDKRCEVKLPNVDLFIKEAEKIIKRHSVKTILLQTDSEMILNLARQKIYEIDNSINLIVIDELPRSKNESKSAFHTQTDNRVETAILFNAILRIIAKCKYIILNPQSNVSEYVIKIKNVNSNIIRIS